MTETKANTYPCPTCDGPVPIEEGMMENEILSCPECGAELEVTSLEPFALGVAPEVQEDWGE